MTGTVSTSVMLLLGSLLARQQLSCLESSFGLLWWRDRLKALELRLSVLDRMMAVETGGKGGALEVGLHLSSLMNKLKVKCIVMEQYLRY